jgi:UDP-glucose 4-epimerase
MIIVIGATGFIGSYLIEALVKENKKVVATGRRYSALNYYKERNIPCIEFDISKKEDFEKLPKENVEAIVLLSALLPANSIDNNSYDYVNTNIIGTLNTLEYCRTNNIKKIISTTSYADVVGFWEKDVALPDDHVRSYSLSDDHASYVISKNAATDFILHYNETCGMSGIIFRLPPVYGVGPHSEIYVDGKLYKSGFQLFIDKAITGEDIELYGDKNVSRDVVSVKDVVSAFVKAVESGRAKGIYNITSGKSVTLEEQVKAIIKVFSTGEKISSIKYNPEKTNNSKSYLFDISKAKKDFGYDPQYVEFEKLVADYKNELENGHYEIFFKDRKKK